MIFWFEPKLNLFRLLFGLFREAKKNFRFVSVFSTSIETTKTNRIYGRGNLVHILTNLQFFRLVFCLFRLFQNTDTPCFDIKAKQPKQTPVLDSAKTSLGYSFGCFDTKLVLEDTLLEIMESLDRVHGFLSYERLGIVILS